jgi:hypothetical protein
LLGGSGKSSQRPSDATKFATEAQVKAAVDDAKTGAIRFVGYYGNPVDGESNPVAPDASIGQDGDRFVRFTDGDISKTITGSYTKKSGAWVVDTSETDPPKYDPDNFNVLMASAGAISSQTGTEWYYLGGSWNQLDFSGAAADNVTVEVVAGKLQIKDLGVGTTKLAEKAVTQGKIADGAVGTDQLAATAVTNEKLDGMLENSVKANFEATGTTPQDQPITGTGTDGVATGDPSLATKLQDPDLAEKSQYLLGEKDSRFAGMLDVASLKADTATATGTKAQALSEMFETQANGEIVLVIDQGTAS